MKSNSVIHIRAETSEGGGGQTIAEGLSEADRRGKDPTPLTKCGRYDVPREESENPPPGDYSSLEGQARDRNSTLCPRCLYVDNHPLLRTHVPALAVAQAQEDLLHIYVRGANAALCGVTSGATTKDPDKDPFHVCLACAVEHARLQEVAAG